MELSIHHHKVFVDKATDEETRQLSKSLKIWYTDFQQQLKSDNLYYYQEQSFPTGYLETVLQKLYKKNIKVTLNDKRVYPAGHLFFSKKAEEFELYQWQKEALTVCETEHIGIVSSLMGTGKSRLMLELFFQKRVKTLIIVPSKTIQKQLYDDFSAAIGKKNVSVKAPKYTGSPEDFFEYGKENPSIIPKKKIGSSYSNNVKEVETRPEKKKFGSSFEMGDVTSTPKKKIGSSYNDEIAKPSLSPEEEFLSRKKSSVIHQKWSNRNLEIKHKYREQTPKEYAVTILCFQSLKTLPRSFLNSVEMVMVDECHHANAKSIRENLLALKNAAYRYGFSATPWKDKYNESMLLISALGEKIIYEKPAKEAIAEGLVAKPYLEMREAPTPDVYLQKFKQWRLIYEYGIVGNKKRNQAIISTAIEMIENGHNVLICVDEISHLEILKTRFEEKKVTPYIIHGQMKTSLKDQSIEIVSHANTGIVSIATMAVGEGANLINVDVVMLAGGGKSTTRFLQRLGRGIRKTKNKDRMTLLDFNDWFNPTLARHSKQRRKTFRDMFE